MEENKGIDILRFGLLGCSDIAPTALIKPARNLPNVEIVAVAARDEARAIKYAKKHAIPRVHPRYEDLIKDPEIDAIYISTPNSHHCKWALEAMAAGKHVLCEKPLASNAEECQQLAAAAQKNGVLLMEAFHYIYHPMMARLKELIKKDIDKIKHIDAKLCFPIFSGKDIRYNYALSGGALMDAGCYTISAVRFLLEEEPEVVSATTKLASPFVDQATTAHLTAPSGATATITASIWSIIPDITLMVEGENGVKLSVVNWVAPHMMYNLLKIEDKNGEWREEKFSRKISTYQHQLAAFIAAVRSGDYSNILTDGIWGVANQSVIDAIYTRLGLPLRGADVAESEPAAATPAPSQ